MSFPPPSPKQARVIWTAVTGLSVAVIIGLVIGVIWGLGFIIRLMSSVIWPLAVAGVVACLLDPVVSFLQRRKVPRVRAVAVVFIAAFLLVGGVTASVIPRVIVETQELQAHLPEIANKLQLKIKNWIEHPPAPLFKILEKLLRRDKTPVPAESTASATNALAATNAPPDAPATAKPAPEGSLLSLLDEDTISKITGWVGDAVRQVGTWLKSHLSRLTSLLGVLAGLALIPIYSFYFLVEKSGISSRWQDYLPVKDSRFKEELVFVISSINDYLIAFFRGQVLVAICDGILYTIGFSLVGLPYAVLLGVVATCLTIIPFLGAIVTCVSALIIAVVAFGDWQHPLMVFGVFFVVQALEGIVIQPKIMGDRVGLHPVTIIIALMVGTTLLGGLLGGILAIPMTAALRVVMFRYIWKDRPTGKPAAESS